MKILEINVLKKNSDHDFYKNAFINGKMNAYSMILRKINNENSSLNDIVEFIISNEQYIEWSKEI